jgi:hypothetical protein
LSKVLIIGLPRTGTTSICAALLEHDFKVAHTALTKQSFELADVIADTPCFADYRQLDHLFPGSRFIYLQRDLKDWIPSVQMLLTKIMNLRKKGKHLHPVIQSCFETCLGIYRQKTHSKNSTLHGVTKHTSYKSKTTLQIAIACYQSTSEIKTA